MSIPPPVAMPTAVMTTAPVSRLPKFTASSSRLTKPALTPKNSSPSPSANGDMGQAASVSTAPSVGAGRLNIGFYHHSVINAGVKTSLISANGKPNGFIRAPTNFKWRKENVEDASADFEYKSGKSANGKKSPSSFSGKALTQNAVSGPKVIPKAGKATQKSTLNCLSKKQNGSSLPKSRSASPLEVKKQAAARSHSSDSIGAAHNGKLTTSDKMRSRSLTQVQRQASPTAAGPKSRAYSTNRAERKAASAAPTVASMLPTAMVKKPLVPRQNGGGNFKVRAGVFKETGPIRVQNEPKRNQRRNSVETPSDPGSSPDTPDSRGPSSERGSLNEVSLEDMSLSSTSSLDHQDTSQEYMDDFDNLGNGGGTLLTSCAQNDDDDSGLDRSRFHDDERMVSHGVSTSADLCFLDDGLDWNHIRLTGDRDHALRRLSRRRRSSQPDYHSQCGSSLDLSPSDSCGSGGTFLWDEEVEPLGGAVQIPPPQAPARSPTGLQNGFHQSRPDRTEAEPDRSDSLRVGSLHSDLSSIDVLNDLESCDLDEDDLMLDVDFPEDHSLTSDRGSYMAEWRRRQLCWGTHNDMDSEFHTDKPSDEGRSKRKDSELSLDLCLSSLKACPGLGVDVEELVDDCSAVKSQLEYLQKILLLQEDDADEDTLTTDTLSPETDSSSSDGTETQVEVLLQEVLQLREEVRSRDRTIAQLSQQLSAVSASSSRCHCEDVERTEVQTQTREKETESRGSQTPWNQSTPAILQPNQSLSDALTNQSGSPSATEIPPPVLPSPAPSSDHVTIAAAEDQSKRTALPSKLRLFMFPGSSHFKSTSSSSPASKCKPTHSPGSRGKLGPAPSCPSPSVSRLPKPKTH